MSPWEGVALGLLFVVLGTLTLIDLRRHILPNRIVVPATVAAAAAAPLLPADGYLSALLGAVTAFGSFALIYYVRPGVIGGGDVKLAALIGFALGFPAALLALAVAPALMALIAIPMILARRWSLRQRVAYGPYMCVGTALLAIAAVA